MRSWLGREGAPGEVAGERGMTAAALLYCLIGGFLIVLAAIQFLLAYRLDGAINAGLGLAFILCGRALLGRKERAFNWALWLAISYAVWSFYLWLVAPSIFGFLIPLCIAAAFLLWRNRAVIGR